MTHPPRTTPDVSPPGAPSGAPPIASALVLAGVALVCLAPVLMGAIPELARSSHADLLGAMAIDQAGLARLARSLAYAAGIGLLATLLAWPASWLSRTRPKVALSVAMIPLLLPAYLASAGLSTLRGPGTLLAAFLADPATDPDTSVLVARVTAVLGLALWGSALGVMVLSGAVRAIPSALLDTMALEPMSAFARARMRARLIRGALIRSVALVALVMLGSSVPLHLAQIDTIAIDLWSQLASSPQRGPAWASAWPQVVLAIAGVCAFVLSAPRPTGAATDPGHGASEHTPRRRATLLVLTLLVFGCGVVLPLILFGATIRDPKAIPAFWRDAWPSVTRSATVAGAASLLTGLGAFTLWRIGAGAASLARARRLALLVAVPFAIAALLPGVMIGSAIAAADLRIQGLEAAPLVVAHAARFGIIPILVALWLIQDEPADRRHARLELAGPSFRAWIGSDAVHRGGALMGAMLGVFLLSIHEIEATVLLDPPGRVRPIAQQMLEDLHRLNDDRLAAGVITMLGAGAVVALVASRLSARLWSRGGDGADTQQA